MNDIFISYASEDRPLVEKLTEALERLNWSVWWDRGIKTGQPFDDTIEDAINNAKCIVVIWSSKSVPSRWVRAEANEGFERNILVPILIEDVRIPLAFRQIQAANLIDWQGDLKHEGFQRLIRDISDVLNMPPTFPSTTASTSKVKSREPDVPTIKEQSTPVAKRIHDVELLVKVGIPVTLIVLWTYSNALSPNPLFSLALFLAVFGMSAFLHQHFNKKYPSQITWWKIVVRIIGGIIMFVLLGALPLLLYELFNRPISLIITVALWLAITSIIIFSIRKWG